MSGCDDVNVHDVRMCGVFDVRMCACMMCFV